MSVSISTHVLDTGRGRPATGVTVELFRAGGAPAERLASGATDEEGRISELARDLEPGPYTLVFHPPSQFFPRVELKLDLADGHHHVPLLVSPYSCTVYRGS